MRWRRERGCRPYLPLPLVLAVLWWRLRDRGGERRGRATDHASSGAGLLAATTSFAAATGTTATGADPAKANKAAGLMQHDGIRQRAGVGCAARRPDDHAGGAEAIRDRRPHGAAGGDRQGSELMACGAAVARLEPGRRARNPE